MALFRKCVNIHTFRMQLCCTEVVIKRFQKILPVTRLIQDNEEIYNKLSKATDMSNEEWMNVQDSIQKTKVLNTNFVNSAIIDMCKAAGNVEGALSFIKFLQRSSDSLHVAVTRKYFSFIVLKKDSITDSEKAEILRLYDDMKTQYPYLDQETCQNCISALSLTERWKEAYELWKTYKTSQSLSGASYSYLASAAFANNDEIIGWEVMENITLTHKKLSTFFYIDYLKFCLRERETFNVNIEKMFDFWKRFNCIVMEEVLSKYMDACNEFGWMAMYTDMDLGQCTKCSQKLLDVTLSKEDFEMLSNKVMQNVIINKDIYWKTSPGELEKFKSFVERNKPFDVVIDGLNVSYISKSKRKNIGMLPEVVNHFVAQNKVILILGRKHMNKSPIFKTLRNHVFIFLVNDLSEDDPFLLYATLASGRDCCFVSIDLMRQNKFLIDDHLVRSKFHQWQVSHQYSVGHDADSNKMKLKEPMKYQMNAQDTGKSWHIPYKSSETVAPQPEEIYELPPHWACFRKPL